MPDLRRLARAAVRMEIGLYRSLWRWVRRRPAVPDGEQAFRYDRLIGPVLWLFVGVSAVEVVAFHLLIPWAWLQGIGLVLGIWGLVWMVGLLASLRMHPHTVGEEGVRVRDGVMWDVLVPWEVVSAVRSGRSDVPNTLKPTVVPVDDGCRVDVGVFGQVTVTLVLARPTVLPIPATEGVPVTVLRVHADDHRAMAAAVRAHLEARSTFEA